MKLLITGATGFLGQQLVVRHRLAGGTVAVLSRDPERARQSLGKDVSAFGWEPTAGSPPREAFAGVQAVVNLAGEPIGQRWTASKKLQLRQSRIDATKTLVDAIASLPSSERPATLVSASGIGIYGDRGDETLTETSSPGAGFLAEMAQEWEGAAMRATQAGLRVVCCRTGLVLSGTGGALPRMLTPFRLGVGGTLGTGRQWMPWIHSDDALGLWQLAIESTTIVGPLNVSAPTPVTNADFTKTLGRLLRRPTVLPAPAFALRLALGEMSELLLHSQRATPAVALQQGFAFAFPEVDAALRDCLAKPAI